MGALRSTRFLFDTAGRMVDTGPGAALDLVLLEKQPDRLLFKIQKGMDGLFFALKMDPMTDILTIFKWHLMPVQNAQKSTCEAAQGET